MYYSISLNEGLPYCSDNAAHGVENLIPAVSNPEQRFADVTYCGNRSSFLLFSVGVAHNGSAGSASYSSAADDGVENDDTSEARTVDEGDIPDIECHCELTNGTCAGCSPECAANCQYKQVLSDIKCAAYSIGRDASLGPELSLHQTKGLLHSFFQFFEGLYYFFGLCSRGRSCAKDHIKIFPLGKSGRARDYTKNQILMMPLMYCNLVDAGWTIWDDISFIMAIISASFSILSVPFMVICKMLIIFYGTDAKGSDALNDELTKLIQDIGYDIGLPKVAQALIDLHTSATPQDFTKVSKHSYLWFDEQKFQYRLEVPALIEGLSPDNLKLASLSANAPSAAAREVNFFELVNIFSSTYSTRLSNVHYAVRIEYVLSAMLHATTCKAAHSTALFIIAITLDSVVRSCVPHDIGNLDILAQYMLLSVPDISPGKGECHPGHVLHIKGVRDGNDTIARMTNLLLLAISRIHKRTKASPFTLSFDTSFADAIKWFSQPAVYQPPIVVLDMFLSDLELSFEADTIRLTSTGDTAVLAKNMYKAGYSQCLVALFIEEAVVSETEIKLKIPGCFRLGIARALAAIRARGFTAYNLTKDQLENVPIGMQAPPLTWSEERVKNPGLQLYDVLNNKFIPWAHDLRYIAVSYSRSEIGYVRTQVEGLMEKCKKFGITMLWVDFMCWKPNQDRAAYFDMINVYWHANATVIIDPYVHRRHVNNSAWSSRIWTRAEAAVSNILMSYSRNQLTTVSNKRRKFRTFGEALSWFHGSVSFIEEDSTIALGGLLGAVRKADVEKTMYACLSGISTYGLLQYAPSADKSLCWLPRVGGSRPSLVQEEIAETMVWRRSLFIRATELEPNLRAIKEAHSLLASEQDILIDAKSVMYLQVATVESRAVCWIVIRQPDMCHVVGTTTFGKGVYRELGIRKVLVNGLADGLSQEIRYTATDLRTHHAVVSKADHRLVGLSEVLTDEEKADGVPEMIDKFHVKRAGWVSSSTVNQTPLVGPMKRANALDAQIQI
ncbi:hypothetical protein K450DRAFT_259450 [Umbelopsis ramanniana AG]|uniref:Uncharacterized protein n=1 Tax=Umbelopsis ramanniana AG TaxID=1314678 RepID=A0AAD5E2E1_UMBRA|nr:uncharacterized protein K450DRAFT_259450 [Umbelopsis ramanniana AG]KAI8575933.1 hypothetical protein K450DRAFT_259450 [Umbelopsis ramanniana AG]